MKKMALTNNEIALIEYLREQKENGGLTELGKMFLNRMGELLKEIIDITNKTEATAEEKNKRKMMVKEHDLINGLDNHLRKIEFLG